MLFVLFNIHGDSDKQLSRKGFAKTEIDGRFIRNKKIWNVFELSPSFGSMYWGLTSASSLDFDQLWDVLLTGEEDEKIGSISIIAVKYPELLLNKIRHSKKELDKKIISLLQGYVIPDHLPLLIDRKKIMDFTFSEEYQNDIWVQILNELKES